ncbi:MAG: M18 family aminopeptidase [Erysipelotrichaceae bacterium]|nr:M18 family aminopeptidase [Erysipelotrichaceae bacterium]
MFIEENLIKFLNGSKTCFQAIDLIKNELNDTGFLELKENDVWKLENNRFYYVTRNDSSIIAFKIPEMIQVKSLNIVASHSDSPCFKVKPVSEFKEKNYTRINVEGYGGMIMASWLDRPLSVAGRVMVDQDGHIMSRLVDVDEDLAIIPSVAIHQNREINNGYKYNPQVDLIPMVAGEEQGNFLMNKVAETLKVPVDAILAHDLFLYNRQSGYVWGQNHEFFSAPRIDNLECAYTSLQAFKNSYSNYSINIYCVFDNEEVGSGTKQGAASTFLSDVIERIFASFFVDRIQIKSILANSFFVSADNAHAIHPNHPELYDKENNAQMNKGVVIKRNAAQSYTTDAISESVMVQLAKRKQVPLQFFANRSDLRGGGTLGSIASRSVSVNMVDIGLPQLAMHSSFETAGMKDAGYMIDLLSEFYSSSIVYDDRGMIIVK